MSTLVGIKQLNSDQYEQAREKAIDRVKARIGQRPTREQFRRELGSTFTILDWLAVVVFLAALIISSAHIVTHMGMLAAGSYHELTAGIVLSLTAYTIAHQVAMIALSEASMLLFMVMHGMTSSQRVMRSKWTKWFSIPLLLAIIAGVFVFVANAQSGIGLLESLMPPMFTIGIGFRLESLIVESIRRRQEIDDRYLRAVEVFERASEDPTKHPDFPTFFKQAVWEKLISLPSNRDWRDAPGGVKAAAVFREMERDAWTNGDVLHVTDWTPEVQRPTNAPRGRSNQAQGDPIGSSAPEPDEDDTTPMIALENERGGENIAAN